MTRRFLALDLGNVLIDYRPEQTTAALAHAARLSGEAAAALAATLPGGLKGSLERGTLSPRAFHEQLNQAIEAAGGRPLGWPDFARGWTAALSARPGAQSLVRRVFPDVALALWSNTDPVHFQHIAPELPVLSGFRALHLSFLVGVAKPERAFYEGALASLGARAEDVVFADDTPGNVEGARVLGIDAFVARDVGELEAELRRREMIS